MNVFNYINNFIHFNSSQTYGDILENKNNKDNAIRRLCSSDEYEDYCKMAKSDKMRFLNNTNKNVMFNESQQPNQITQKNNTPIFVSGIGEVQQIC